MNKYHFIKNILLFLLAITSFSYAQTDGVLARKPTINNDGSLVAFSFQGDIWTVPVNGGKATRLTIHPAYEGNPQFNSDGKSIAFTGERYGNNDVFVIPSEGGVSKRLTFHSSNDQVSSWKGNEIIFSTSREFKRLERPQEVYIISAEGGSEQRILDAVGYDPTYSPNGRFIAFVRGDINPIEREDYRGSSNREIWIYDTKNKTYTKITTSLANDILPKWSGNKTLYYLSTDKGRNNLYSLTLDDNGKPMGSAVALTNYTDHSIRHFDISGDGKFIVLERQANLFLMKTSDKSVNKIDIQIAADLRFDPVENKVVSNGASGYSVSPNGKWIALDIRGEVYVSEANKDKTLTSNISNQSYRDLNEVWLNDSTLLFTSDRDDENFDIYVSKSADVKERSLLNSLKIQTTRITNTPEDENELVVSNDSKKIAFVRGRGKLIVADINADGKISNEKILLDGWATPEGLTWSPDNKYLAYSLPDLYFNEDVFIHVADNSTKPVNVSMHPRSDSRPYWSPDGSKLGFISERNGLNQDVWFVWLKKSDWEKSKEDWDNMEEPENGNDKKGKEKPVMVTIEFDRIHERLVQVTKFPGNEDNIVISKDGKTFYYTGANSTANGNDLYSIKWDGKDVKELTKGGSNPRSVSMDKANKYLYYLKNNGQLNRIETKSEKSETLGYRAKQTIDHVAERNQIFEEAWRTMRDGFYDPNFHGKDWNALRKKYKPLCVMASTNQDFSDMFNYMLGELNSSHQRFTSPDVAETQKDATGWLGVELVPVKEGMKIVRVIPGSPADKSESKLAVNEIITAVEGNTYTQNQNFYSLLNTTVDEKILLTVKGTDSKTREVAIRPVNNITQLLYEEWVEDRKRLVEKYSNGRLGYIHIQGMNIPSLEVFERELTAAGYGKDGLVIDVRYNGGGSTTDLLMTILNYKQHAYTIPRGASDNLERDKTKFRDYYPTGERLVYAAWLKPSIALCNEGSYSNAEIFSHAYKHLGIGKLVGVPTNGSVISTGGKPLMDGSFVRLPFRGWFTKATDKNQELGPAVPDIIVENAPDWLVTNNDAQLKMAVDELIKEINSKK
jgi:C-terminal processing protease CtpA/Prc/tricorn protease-like protein